MKSYLTLTLLVIAIFFNSCTNGQKQSEGTNLSAPEFAQKINELPSAPIIDVRTPSEFSKGHLNYALNVDWNGNDFENQISTLDKSKPVLVYCLSGGRSSAAAAKMRSEGFQQVYELAGGIMKWRAANLPENASNGNTSQGMSRQQFDSFLNTDKLVLIDFYADWCAPCKKMKPYLEEISKDMADKVVVIRINADDNQALCRELKIDALPVLQIYRNKTLNWANSGFIDKENVLQQLK